MRINLLHLFLLFILLLSFSCNNIPKNKIYHVEHLNDIECKNIPAKVFQIQNRINTNLSSNYFTYFNSNNNTVGIFFIDKNYTINISTPLQFLKKRRTYSNFFVYSLDSIFYFDRNLSGIFLFDSSGTVLNEFSIKSSCPPNPMTTNFFVFSKYLYYSWLPRLDMRTKYARKQALDTISPICKVDINNPLDSNNFSCFGVYPYNYKTGRNYYNFGPSIFVGLKNQIIISYASDHDIYIYKGSELITQKSCKSNFIAEFKDIPDKYISNLSYCQNFIGQEPKYTKLITDPYNKRYYRVTKLRMKLDKFNIKSAKWSIIIMDESFNIIGEALLPYSEYMPDIIIPSQNGLYIKRSPKNKEDFNGNLFLSLINFKQ